MEFHSNQIKLHYEKVAPLIDEANLKYSNMLKERRAKEQEEIDAETKRSRLLHEDIDNLDID